MKLTRQPTTILFLWHMHQPYYRKVDEETYFTPWTRLHGVKDYYGFARLLSKYPFVKANFNFSPVLIDQILDYTQNRAKDRFLILTLKKPQDLTESERAFILKRFFPPNKKRMIEIYPEYWQLYQKTQNTQGSEITDQEIRDIQLYFNLAWFHHTSIEEDSQIKEFINKKSGFTEKDKLFLINKQYQILSQIIPLYKELVKSGQIEISITPYYHPILPLLCDTDIMNHFEYLKTPKIRFSYPQEAEWHIKEAKIRAERIFDSPIHGSWPSEGSVSDAVLRLYNKNEFRWVVTDEDILHKTAEQIYKSQKNTAKRKFIDTAACAYKYKDINVLFRNKEISNALSFTYHGWENLEAAAFDIIKKMEAHNAIEQPCKKKHLLIAMDGENAWEYYRNNAKDFFETLYTNIEKNPNLKSQTISGYLKTADSINLPAKIWPGSWINADFGVWAGSDKNNANWELLARIKQTFDNKKPHLSKEIQNLVSNYLHILEGSDWNWWNTFTEETGDFEEIFFSYINKIGELLGEEVR